MGVLIVLGTTVVIGTVIHRVYSRFAAPSMPVPLAAPTAPATPVPAAVSVATSTALAPGEHIAGIAAAGADVAVWVNGPNGDRLLLLNPVTGQVSVALQGGR